MDKARIKKMLAKQIKIIETTAEDMASARWARAKAFFEIHGMIVWDKSPYKTFRDFVEQEFTDINPGTAVLWTINYNQMSKLYSWKDIQIMAKSISYTRAVKAQQTWGNKKKVSIQQFIKIAKKIKFNNNNPIPVHNPNRITLILPNLYIAKLEATLVPHGYTIPKHKTSTKTGISEAFVKYLDTI